MVVVEVVVVVEVDVVVVLAAVVGGTTVVTGSGVVVTLVVGARVVRAGSSFEHAPIHKATAVRARKIRTATGYFGYD